VLVEDFKLRQHCHHNFIGRSHTARYVVQRQQDARLHHRLRVHRRRRAGRRAGRRVLNAAARRIDAAARRRVHAAANHRRAWPTSFQRPRRPVHIF
jgi:hypothetical protein